MANTRDRIIVSTNELFRRFGYNGTSLSQISKAANAPIGSIYHFFPGGKEEVAVAVIETTGAVYLELFHALAAQASDPARAYQDFFEAMGAALEESDYIDGCPIGGVAREVANTSEPLRLAAAKVFESWIEAATAHLVGVGVQPEVAAELADVLVATIEGMFVLSRTLRSAAPLRSAGRAFSQLVAAAIEEGARVPR